MRGWCVGLPLYAPVHFILFLHLSISLSLDHFCFSVHSRNTCVEFTLVLTVFYFFLSVILVFGDVSRLILFMCIISLSLSLFLSIYLSLFSLSLSLSVFFYLSLFLSTLLLILFSHIYHSFCIHLSHSLPLSLLYPFPPIFSLSLSTPPPTLPQHVHAVDRPCISE